MTVREPRWTEQDRAELLALGEYRALLCPCGCGHLEDDTTSHEDGGPAFTASRAACRARLALIEAQRAADDGKPNPSAGARIWRTQLHRG